MPADADGAFWLWAQATEAGNWGLILDAPASAESYVALKMLSEFKPLRSMMLAEQTHYLKAIAEKG